ncbi:hypothetical protein JCGZ_05745 [Jatropha curcas]|uniref:Uncharacterized protein n=1 Tax=Jatropha curcas TaxID=180498 RepID=A0A067LAQ0_JATCU|nr:hypothetical protein JCGZ_05745 [Jatropha curcas]
MEDIIVVDSMDKKFDKEAHRERLEMQITLDVNTEIYPIKIKDKFALLITPTLHADGTGDTGYYIQPYFDMFGYYVIDTFIQNRVRKNRKEEERRGIFLHSPIQHQPSCSGDSRSSNRWIFVTFGYVVLCSLFLILTEGILIWRFRD